MKKRILIIVTCLVALVGILYLSFRQPLIPAKTLQTKCIVGDKPIDGIDCFKPLLVSNVHYIHLPSRVKPIYQWFLIRWSTKSVSVPVAPPKGDSRFRHVHSDQIKGINLLNPKIEDSWRVVFDKNTVRFTNGNIDITVEK